MYLKPMRRTSHDRHDVDTLCPCGVHNIIIKENAQVVTYHETVKTKKSDCLPLCELFHNIFEEFKCELSYVTRKYKTNWIASEPFLLRP